MVCVVGGLSSCWVHLLGQGCSVSISDRRLGWPGLGWPYLTTQFECIQKLPISAALLPEPQCRKISMLCEAQPSFAQQPCAWPWQAYLAYGSSSCKGAKFCRLT